MPASKVSVLITTTLLWSGVGKGGSAGAYVSNSHATQAVWLTFGGEDAVASTGALIPPGETVYIQPEFAEQECNAISVDGTSDVGFDRINP